MQILTKTTKTYTDTRFETDKVIFGDSTEQFNESIYELWIRCDNDVIANVYKSNDDKQIELVIGTIDNTPYLITAIVSSYAGEQQVNYSHQELTLNGLASFAKGLDPRLFIDIYDNILSKYDVNDTPLTYEDLVLLAELHTDYNCSVLALEDNNRKVWLTVNAQGFFSKETIKLKDRPVNTKSAFSRG